MADRSRGTKPRRSRVAGGFDVGTQAGPSEDHAAPSTDPPTVPLLTVVGDTAKMEGKFEIADSIQIECEVRGDLRVGGKLVIGEKGVVKANVETMDAIIEGHYDGTMTATGNVEIAATGRVSGNIKTDSLVVTKGGSFRGNVTKINEEPATNHRPLSLIEDMPSGEMARDNSQMLEPASPTWPPRH